MGLTEKKEKKPREEWQRKTIAEKIVYKQRKNTCELKHYVMNFSLIRGYHLPLRSLPLRLASCCALITASSGRNANYSKDLHKRLQCLCCGMIITDSRMPWIHFLGGSTSMRNSWINAPLSNLALKDTSISVTLIKIIICWAILIVFYYNRHHLAVLEQLLCVLIKYTLKKFVSAWSKKHNTLVRSHFSSPVDFFFFFFWLWPVHCYFTQTLPYF